MPLNQTNVLRARVVMPVSRPPIEDGAVVVAGRRIIAVGRWRDLSAAERAQTVDLGAVILLPGLVNAHCHLDYTGMAGQLPPPRSFIDWLKLITTTKSGWYYSEYAAAWLAGAKMLLHTGSTTVGDIEMIPELLPEVWTATPLRIISFLEMTGVRSRRPPAMILREALDKISDNRHRRCRIGLSPHAPYSTTRELLRLAGRAASRRNLRVATHVSESEPEFEMFMHGRGPMFEWLARSQRDMSDCGHGSPVRHLKRHGLLAKNLLAVHVNYLAPGDARLLARHNVSVVHCPRSHAYFKHQPFPVAELVSAGVNICLGTDSLASVYQPRRQSVELNLFEEMRAFARVNPTQAPGTILEMATINGARALGLRRRIGELSPRTFADLITLPFAGKITAAAEAIIQHPGKVSASMIEGEWAIPPQS